MYCALCRFWTIFWTERRKWWKERENKSCKSKVANFNCRNNYKEQCLLVPDDTQDATHGVHLTPCWKTLTFILAGESLGEQSNQQLSKRSSDGNSTWVHLEVCRFLRKDVSYRGKKVGLEKLDMKEAELLIKQIAWEKDTEHYYEMKAFRFNCKLFLVS